MLDAVHPRINDSAIEICGEKPSRVIQCYGAGLINKLYKMKQPMTLTKCDHLLNYDNGIVDRDQRSFILEKTMKRNIIINRHHRMFYCLLWVQQLNHDDCGTYYVGNHYL